MIPGEATLIELGTVLRDDIAAIDRRLMLTGPMPTQYEAVLEASDGRRWRLVLTPERESPDVPA